MWTLISVFKPPPKARRIPLYSDSTKLWFWFNREEKRAFVRTGLENTGRTNDFQAYDEGSIPFTRSSFFDPLKEARFIAPARLLD